ncbi:MAG: ankyrin repeat domain-containing protein [Bacteroidota bacterium]
MKTLKAISISTLTLATLIFAVLSMTSCNNSSGNEAPEMTIHAATFMGNLKAVEQHIAAGTELNATDEYGSTPLIIAATFDKPKIAKALIKGGANMSATGGDGSTPLHTAAFMCRVEIVKALLANGADKNLRNNYGSTPLQSVEANFADVKPIYEQLNKDLGAAGFRLDYGYLEKTRPLVAEILKTAR